MHSEVFKMEHLTQIEALASKDSLRMLGGTIRANALSGKLIGFSLIHEQKVIAIGGVNELWQGVGEAFSVMSKSIFKYPKSLYKAFKLNLNTGLATGQYNRIHASVECDFPEGIRFIEKLGFKREGRMELWGPDGKDYYMYARLQ